MKIARDTDCTSCMACIDSCHKGALSFSINEEGFYHICFDESLCVNCGLCTKVCPVLHKPQKGSSCCSSMAVWDKNDYYRAQAASGGAFSAVARVVLEKGGVVYGAAIDKFRVRHTRIDKVVDLCKLQGSKYQQSETNGIYRKVKKDLLSGKIVLFSGMSCQIAGLFSYLGEKRYVNLYTIDTICGGTSSMLPILSMEKSGLYSGIFSFRDKSHGWKPKGFRYSLKMITKNGIIDDLGSDNIVIKSFCTPFFKRSSCMNCRNNGFHRQSDCTICDFWGVERFEEQHAKGISGMIINNHRIVPFIEESSLISESVPLEMIIEHNPSYYWNKYKFYITSRQRKLGLKYLKNNETGALLELLNGPYDLGLKIKIRINNLMKQIYYKMQMKYLKS